MEKDSFNQAKSDFDLKLEILRRQDLKLEEAKILEEKLRLKSEQIQNQMKMMKQEIAEREAALEKSKIEYFTCVKIDSQRCEVMSCELNQLKKNQENQIKLSQQLDELTKRHIATVEESRQNLKRLREQYDSETLKRNINIYKDKIGELKQQLQDDSHRESLKKYENPEKPSCPEADVTLKQLKSSSKPLQQTKEEQRKVLKLLETIEQKKKELVHRLNDKKL